MRQVKTSTFSKGRRGEEAAIAYLSQCGAEVLARNFRSQHGEVDVVVREGDSLVFVEVKAWQWFGFEELWHSLGPAKQERIKDAALHFVQKEALRLDGLFASSDFYLRFDLVYINSQGEAKRIINAF